MPKVQLKSSEQPPAIGYIRLNEEDAGRFALLLKDIAACCLREDLRLVRTFTDQGYDGSQLARHGIADMHEALPETPGLVVVVPTLDHLSPAEVIRSPLILMVHRLGGRLLVACEPNDKADDFDVAQYGLWVGGTGAGDESP